MVQSEKLRANVRIPVMEEEGQKTAFAKILRYSSDQLICSKVTVYLKGTTIHTSVIPPFQKNMEIHWSSGISLWDLNSDYIIQSNPSRITSKQPLR